mmetsp:Transcript_22835/g.48660  ORF Transcript_22835/g.48660 Transcript_22835/m.48660 type:complete len:216 (-) Transcript_22835:467-1114(-)
MAARSVDAIDAMVSTSCTLSASILSKMFFAKLRPAPCSQHTCITKAETSAFELGSSFSGNQSSCSSCTWSMRYFPTAAAFPSSKASAARNCALANCMPTTNNTFAATFAKDMKKLASIPSSWSSWCPARKPSGERIHRNGKTSHDTTRNTNKYLRGLDPKKKELVLSVACLRIWSKVRAMSAKHPEAIIKKTHFQIAFSCDRSEAKKPKVKVPRV